MTHWGPFTQEQATVEHEDGRQPYTGTLRPEPDARELLECFPSHPATLSRPGRYGAALVLDGFGMWHWYRRDYRSIRDLVELGIQSDRPDYIGWC